MLVNKRMVLERTRAQWRVSRSGHDHVCRVNARWALQCGSNEAGNGILESLILTLDLVSLHSSAAILCARTDITLYLSPPAHTPNWIIDHVVGCFDTLNTLNPLGPVCKIVLSADLFDCATQWTSE